MKEYLTVKLLQFTMRVSDNDLSKITDVLNQYAKDGWQLKDTICFTQNGVTFGILEREKN